MSCFTQHLGGLMDEIGIENTKENRRKLADKIARIVGLPDRNCPDVWHTYKTWAADEDKKAKLTEKLRQAMAR